MDPLRRDLVTLAWGPDLLVSTLEGGAEGVLGRPASELVGRPLAHVLGTSDTAARQLNLRARPEGLVEHLTCERDEHRVVLRVTAFALEGDLRAASVLNLTALLDDAPPFAFSWLERLHHVTQNHVDTVKLALDGLARNPGLSARDQRRLTIARRELREIEWTCRLLKEYSRDEPLLTEPVSVRSLFEDAARMVEELLERRVEFAFQEDGDIPVVKMNRVSLAWALSQLLLDVTLRLHENRRIEIMVRRFGKGAQAVIRDPSSSLRPDRQHARYQPFGLYGTHHSMLSLAVLRQVMRRHGGLFLAENDASGGMRYSLWFVS